MGLFKRKPMDCWVHDLQGIVDADPDQFRNMRRYDDSTYVVDLAGQTEVWITNDGRDMYFIVGLGSAKKMGEQFHMSVEEVYAEMTQYVTSCSVGIDGDGNMRFATVIPGRDYSADRLRDLMYRWTFQAIDYDSALETFIEAHGGGSR